jgi:uncharacterized membrane protein YdjX (TVP38/TMEM64 family)
MLGADRVMPRLAAFCRSARLYVRLDARFAWAACGTGVLFVALYLVSRLLPEALVRAAISSAGAAAPALLVALLLLTNVVAPLSSSPLVFAGFYAFGRDVVVYVFVASWLAMVTNFWIARRVGRGAVERMAGQERMGKIDRACARYGLVALIALRVFESEVQKFVSYAYGLSTMRFSTYVVVSTLGMLPGTLVWFILAEASPSALMFTLWTQAIGVGLSVLFVVGVIVRRSWTRDSRAATG